MPNMIERLFDKYTVIARLFPAALCSLPFLVPVYILSSGGLTSNFWSYVASVEFIGSLTGYVVFIFLYAVVIQNFSKLFERRYFQNRDGFPTTYLMLFEDRRFSDAYKRRFRTLIAETFDVSLLSKEEENANPGEARRRLDEAIGQVRSWVGEGSLVHDKNILYGFVRNMTGGSVLAVLVCIGVVVVNYFVWQSSPMLELCLVLLVGYSIYIGAHKFLILQTAESYAQQLIDEFMASTKEDQ